MGRLYAILDRMFYCLNNWIFTLSAVSSKFSTLYFNRKDKQLNIIITKVSGDTPKISAYLSFAYSLVRHTLMRCAHLLYSRSEKSLFSTLIEQFLFHPTFEPNDYFSQLRIIPLYL